MDKKQQLLESLKRHGFPEKIINAFGKVNREEFIPKENKRQTYEDIPLPIGYNQTISQPYTIAFMLNLLDVKNKQKILEVGSGSGYVLALISELNPKGKVFGIERIKELAESSEEKLKQYNNVKVVHENGFLGLEKKAPFDRILVSASAEKIPERLIKQLKKDGILVVPVKHSILKITRNRKIEEYPGFAFVPLIEE